MRTLLAALCLCGYAAADDTARIEELRSQLAVTGAVIEANHDEVTSQLRDHTDRLNRIESAIDELGDIVKKGPVIQPPVTASCPCGDNCNCPAGSCPGGCPSVLSPAKMEIPAAEIVAKPETPSRVETILANYRGSDWVVRGEPLRKHLQEDHGFTSAEIAGLTDKQLRRLHGAAHTKHWSYTGGAPSARAMVRVTQPARQTRRVYYRNCPNGRCPIR